MQLADFAAVVGVWLVAIAAPGPDVVLVLRQTVRGGRPAGVAAAAGVVLGIVAWIALAMVGAHVLVEADDRILGTLEIVGGAYLIGLGVAGVRAALVPGGAHEFELGDLEPTPEQEAEDWAADHSGHAGHPQVDLVRRSFGLGLLTNLSNPKALIFFGAVFTVLIPQDASVVDRVSLSIVLVVIAGGWFGGLAVLTSSARVGEFLGRHAARLDTVAAVAFALLGAVSLVTGLATFR